MSALKNFSQDPTFDENQYIMSFSSGLPWYYVAYSVICAIGVCTNIVNIMVFMNPKLKDKVFKYMLVSCISELFYLLISGLATLTQCGELCIENSSTLMGQIFTLYIFYFLAGSLAIFTVLVEIFLSFQRYMILRNRRFLVKTNVCIIASVLFVLSLLVNVPTVTNFEIIPLDPSANTYIMSMTPLGISDHGKLLKSASGLIRTFLTCVVLTTFSLMTAVKSRDHFMKKNKILISGFSLSSLKRTGKKSDFPLFILKQ